MFFDIGWPELMLIGAIALVVIGPKDLPRALRVAGFWVRKARTLSREFQGSIDQMIREAELDEVRQELKKATEFDLEKEFKKTVDPTGELAESIKPPHIPDFFDETASANQHHIEPLPAIGEAMEGPAAGHLVEPVIEPVEEQLPLPLPSVPEPQIFEPVPVSAHDPSHQPPPKP
ncbi:MAG: twin-arginine translocase subunit TatB [Alphaproteobacteria bacterium]|nr:twin-arginine translocase subunit TatB [Alphaproteobacteria bacterium]